MFEMEIVISMVTIILTLTLAAFLSHVLLVGDDAFKKRWPAISDDEFMERCKPGTNRDIALRVRKIVSEQLGVPYQHIYPEQSFVDDLGCG